MSPRAALPGADELFRATSPGGVPRDSRADPAAAPARPAPAPPAPASEPTARPRQPVVRRRGDHLSSGRERHEEKITVYVSADELVALEQARLTLRADHGIAVDRGRIVREALSMLLADLDSNAADSNLVRRLADS